MGCDAFIYAKNAKRVAYLGRAYRLGDDIDFSGSPQTAEELTTTMDDAIREMTKDFLASSKEEEDEWEFNPFFTVKHFLQAFPNDTYYLVNDYTDPYPVVCAEYTDYDYDVSVDIRAYVSQTEVVIWNPARGYLAVTKDDWANRTPESLRARLLGIRDSSGSHHYLTLWSDDGAWELSKKFVVSDR